MYGQLLECVAAMHSHVAVQADVGSADFATRETGVCGTGGCGHCSTLMPQCTSLYPPLCGLLLKVSSSLVAGGAPGVAISSQGLECCRWNVALLQEGFEVILEALFWTPSRSLAIQKLAVKDLPGQAVDRHTDHMPNPA